MRRGRDGGQPRCSARKGPQRRICHTHKARDAAMRAAGLSKVRLADATNCLDNATESHHHSPGMANRTASATPMAAPKGRGHRRCPSQGDPRLRRGQTPTAVASSKNPENLERDSTPITAGRGSCVFPLTRAVTGRINKQELLDAITLEPHICPLPLSFSTPSPAQDPGSIHPRHQNGAAHIQPGRVMTRTLGSSTVVQTSGSTYPQRNARSMRHDRDHDPDPHPGRDGRPHLHSSFWPFVFPIHPIHRST